MNGAAADASPLHDADAEIVGRAPAAVLEQEGQHLLFALIEVGRRVVPPLFERDDLRARLRELAQHHRAPRACADDDGVDVERDVLRQVAPTNDHRVHPPAGRFTSGPSYPRIFHVRASR